MQCVICKSKDFMRAVAFNVYWCGNCGCLDAADSAEKTIYKAKASNIYIKQIGVVT